MTKMFSPSTSKQVVEMEEEMYIDRGDAPVTGCFDFDLIIAGGDLHELDLSGIVPPAGANHLVHLKVEIYDQEGHSGSEVNFSKNGNEHTDTNSFSARTPSIDHEPEMRTYFETEGWVMMDSNRKIQYFSTPDTVTAWAHVIVRGWFE